MACFLLLMMWLCQGDWGESCSCCVGRGLVNPYGGIKAWFQVSWMVYIFERWNFHFTISRQRQKTWRSSTHSLHINLANTRRDVITETPSSEVPSDHRGEQRSFRWHFLYVLTYQEDFQKVGSCILHSFHLRSRWREKVPHLKRWSWKRRVIQPRQGEH